MKTYKINTGILALVAALLFFAASTASAEVTPAEAQQIAEKAYTYGLQQVIFFGQRYIYTQDDSKDNQSYVGVNRFYNVREKITPDFPVVTPNATTLYGTGFLDLQKEPMIIEMPAITDRYFSLQIMNESINILSAGPPADDDVHTRGGYRWL